MIIASGTVGFVFDQLIDFQRLSVYTGTQYCVDSDFTICNNIFFKLLFYFFSTICLQALAVLAL